MAHRNGGRPPTSSPSADDHFGAPLVELQGRRSTTPLSGTTMHSSEDAVRSEIGSTLATPTQAAKSDRERPQPVELDPNPPPQVEVGTAPEALIPIPDIGCQEPEERAACQDIIEDTQQHQQTPVRPGIWERFVQPLRKCTVRIPIWAWAIIAIITLAAVIIGIFYIVRAVKNSHAASPSPEPTNTTTATSTPPVSTPTITPLPGCEPSTYTPGVDWVGIANGQNWQFSISKAGSDVGCCNTCTSDTAGCNAWLYIPDDSNATDCSIIVGYTGPNAGGQCPQGKPDIEFNYVNGNLNNAGGLGPCAGSIQG